MDKNPTVVPRVSVTNSVTLFHLAAENGEIELCKLIIPHINVKNPKQTMITNLMGSKCFWSYTFKYWKYIVSTKASSDTKLHIFVS